MIIAFLQQVLSIASNLVLGQFITDLRSLTNNHPNGIIND